MSEIYLTNSLTRRKELFEPADPARVTMYVCGPTVYNYAHIGNARPAVVFDVLFRLLRKTYGENAVVYASNFTDIDDRIIDKANELGVPIDEVTRKFERIYREDVTALGVLPPTLTPRATGHVADMIVLIERLIERGAAYRVESGVYFAVERDKDYGKLSNRSQDELRTGTRVEGEDDKRAPSDFALWKTAKPDEPSWEAPFGAGRPGWHIECSAMIEAALGLTIDMHGGGADLLFPHHENEIAQSETAHDHPLARFWLHNGFLTVDGEKMSKSIGNVLLVHDLLRQWPGEVLRWALLSAHYRAPLDWSNALMEQSKASLDRLYGVLERLKNVPHTDDVAPPRLMEALRDDLNTPKAIAELSALATEANTATTPVARGRSKGALLAAGALMGVLNADPDVWFGRTTVGGQLEDVQVRSEGVVGPPKEEIQALVDRRTAARKAKDWAEADRLRAVLSDMGIVVMDGPDGSTWRRA